MLRRLITFFFLVFVLGSTFSISLSQSALGIATILFAVAAVRERFNPFGGGLRWFWLAVAAYLGWLVVVCLLQDNPLRALNFVREEWLFAVIPVGVYLGQDRRVCDQIIKVLAVGLLIVSTASLFMYLFGVRYHWPDGFVPLPEGNLRVQGNFTNALTFGNYAAIGSLFVLTWALSNTAKFTSWRTVALASSISGLVAVLFCGSRGPILAALAGLVVLSLYLMKTRRFLSVSVLLALLLVGVLTPSVRSRFTTELGWHFNREWPGGRLFIWERALDMVAEHPLTGVGPGNFPEEYKKRLDLQVTSRFWYQHAHNDFLESAARSGLPGAVTFAGIWVAVLISLWRGRHRAVEGSYDYRFLLMSLVGSLVFLVGSLTEATFSDEEVRVLLMLVWATGLAVVYNRQNAETAEHRYVA